MLQQTRATLERALLPQGDYVSPNLEVVRVDRCFPHMRLGNPQQNAWPYLRRHIPHNWYVDERWPVIGWLSRDEAHLLHHNARQFQGLASLEIGCFCGWSTCHLALAGVYLDVIDPLLARPEFADTVRTSLELTGRADRVQLHPGESPGLVEQLGQERSHSPWALIFIDGEHGGLGPLRDAQICARFAAADAMILFHDLVCPDVAKGLAYLREQGWQTMIYQTMQIMGVAWRGKVQPVSHHPDPTICWDMPDHLKEFPVSGVLM